MEITIKTASNGYIIEINRHGTTVKVFESLENALTSVARVLEPTHIIDKVVIEYKKPV